MRARQKWGHQNSPSQTEWPLEVVLWERGGSEEKEIIQVELKCQAIDVGSW